MLGVISLLGCLIAVYSSEVCSSSTGCCPPLWQSWGNSQCYRLTQAASTWEASRSACIDLGGQMFASRSSEENNQLLQIGNAESLDYLWLACNDIDIEGDWRCEGIERSDTFIVWGKNEPNNANNNEDCAFMGMQSPGILDGSCVGPAKAVCIRDQEYPQARQRQPSSKYCFTIGSDQRLITSCLVDHVIGEFVTKSMTECALACSKEPRCLSFNIKQTKEANKRLCQLNNATSSEDPTKFKTTESSCIYSDL